MQVGADHGLFSSTITFSYDGRDEFLEPEAEAVANFYARLIDIMTKKMKASLNRKIYESLKKVMEPDEKTLFISQRKCGFSRVKEHVADLRKKIDQKKAESLPEVVNDTEVFITYPTRIEFSYDGKNVVLTPEAKAVEWYYTSVLYHKYTPGKDFIKDIFNNLKEVMTDNEKERFDDQEKCDFLVLLVYFRNQAKLRKRQNDEKKFDNASIFGRNLDNIRSVYREHLNNGGRLDQRRAVALYFMDELALRAGHKEGGEIDDAVGCCNLMVGHITLPPGEGFVVEFKFFGKCCIPYQKKVPVEETIYRKIKEFMLNKGAKHQLFDELTADYLNEFLVDRIPEVRVTATVFRTYRASIILQEELRELNFARDTSIPSKVLAFKYAVCAAAVLLNHRRAVPDAFNRQMANLQNKIKAKMIILESTKDNLNKYPHRRNQKKKQKDMKKAVKMLEDQLAELEMKAKYKEDSKDINIATTIGYYLDPRIIVAWCKNSDVPVEKVYNRTQRDKFRWAIDMAEDLLNYNF